MTAEQPPSYPTKEEFVPEYFEVLTDAERLMCPAPQDTAYLR